MKKVVILGLDGASFEYMNPWLSAGDLPNIRELMARGVYGTLESTFLPVTALAWPSMLTGKNPGKHGIFDFATRRSGSYELEPAEVRGFQGAPLHLYLSQRGYRVGMVNVPMTYPPRPLNGVLISGFTTPETATDWAWPPALPEKLRAAGVPYPISLLHDLMRMEKQRRARYEIERFIQGWGKFTRAQAAVVSHLLRHDNFDFFMIVFSSTDHINHHTPDLDHIRRIYQQVDQAVGDIVEAAGPDAIVFVVSDHGSAPLKRFIVLNRFLADLGLIAFRPEVAPHFVQLAAARVSWRWQSRVVTLWRALPSVLRRLLSWPLLYIEPRLRYDYANIDWQHTRAYARSGVGTIYVNLKGREPQGVVEPGTEYEALRDRIIEGLRSLRDPETGQPLIAEIYRGEEVFHGPCMDDAPDLVFRPCNTYDRFISGFASDPLVRPAQKWEKTYVEYGYHTQKGILIVTGPGIRAGIRIEGARIYDIAPTVLYLLGLPVPRDVDGRVLLDLQENPREVMYTEPVEEGLPRSGAAVLSGDERRDIEARLRALGYLE